MALTSEQQFIGSYIANGTLGIAPGGYMTDLANIINANNGNMQAAVTAVVGTPLFASKYPAFLSNEQFATSYATNLLGSSVSAATLTEASTYVASLLNAGNSRGTVVFKALEFLYNVSTADAKWGTAAATLQNKASVGQYYTIDKLGASTDTSVLSTMLSTVTQDAATVTAAKAAIDSGANGSQSGSNFTLAAAIDNVSGTAGNDTFVATATATAAAGTPFAAASTSMNTADKLVGGAGIDTLNITVDGAENSGSVAYNLPAADVSGIEVINVRNVATVGTDTLTVNAGNFVGATEFYSDRSTTNMAFTNVAAGSTVGFKGNGTNAATGDVTATYLAGVTAANVSLQGGHSTTTGANTATLAVNGANLTSATITANGGGTNTIAGVAFGGAVTALTVDAQSNIATGNITGLAAGTKVTVKGAGTANIGTLQPTNVTEVDASANTGGVTATLNNVTGLKFTGGAGNDVLTTGAVLTTGLVDAGAGTTDRLIVTAAGTDHIDATTGKLYKNFEQVQVQDGETVNLSHLATTNTIDTIRINDSDNAAGTGVTNLSATQAANVTILAANATGAITIGVKDATTAGQIDTVKASLVNTNATGTAGVTVDLTGLTLDGVEKLELTTTGTSAATADAVTLTTTNATALDSIKLASAANGNSITIAAGQATNLVVDASASTGDVTIDANLNNATTGVNLKGGSSFDVLKGAAGLSDILTGGAGNDVLVGGAATVTAGTASLIGSATAAGATTAADTYTGGEGRDMFVLGTVNTVANASSITDLNLGGATAALGVDGITLNLATAGAATIVVLTDTQKANIAAAASLAAAVDLAAAADTTVNAAVQFTYGTDTYLFVNGVAAGAAYNATEDALVKITGVSGTLGASDLTIN